jgi:lysophospholipase L1-like esterase
LPVVKVSKRSRSPKVVEAPASIEPAAAPLSPRRAWVFRGILLALPFIVLGLLELGLRIGGFGHGLEPLFVASPQHPEYLQANPRAVARFFNRPEDAPAVSIETAYFRAQKRPGTFRVFVQGESSAAGFPYGLGASLAGVLDQRFERAFPDREVEVISTAMAAVNSYALLDFADEIIAQQPDSVVIYVGHNEYLGILGVGSSLRMASRPWLTRAFLAARDCRLFQLMARVLEGTGAAREEPLTTASDTLMARVAGERSIPLRSELFGRGAEQFATNLGSLLEKYRRAGVPVFIGTLVSNERDQMPLAVLSGAESDSAGAAKTAFLAAQDAEGLGDFNAARQGYAWARDLDPLRFRAPSMFNEVVARLANVHGATLVDVHQAFVDASPHGLIGNGLVLEHVHPNLDGYSLLADAFFRSMVGRGVPGRPQVVVPGLQAMLEMPVSDIDRWLGDYKVTRVKSAWPFTPNSVQPALPPPRSEGERLAQEVYAQRMTWPEAQDALRQYYRSVGNKAEYTRGTAILADAFPFTPGIQFESAAALIDAGRPADALRYARRAIDLEPRSINNLLVTAHALLLTGHREQGRATLEQVLRIDPQNPTAMKVLGELQSSEPAH